MKSINIWNNHYEKNKSDDSCIEKPKYNNYEEVMINLGFLSKKPNQNEKSIIQIGCGTSKLLEYIINNYNNINSAYGLDISNVALNQAKKILNNPNIELIQGDAINIPIRSDIFDKLYHIGLVEHFSRNKKTGEEDIDIESVNKAISESIRILKPSGKIFFIQPNYYSFAVIDRIIKQKLGIWSMGYQKEFKREEFIKLFQDNGLINIKTEIIGAPEGLPIMIRKIDETIKTITQTLDFITFNRIKLLNYFQGELGMFFAISAEKPN